MGIEKIFYDELKFKYNIKRILTISKIKFDDGFSIKTSKTH